MGTSRFVHLHLHTDYSLLDGACEITELVDEAARRHMPAVAVTDHGNLFAAEHFYHQATTRGVKPIIGCEVYVARGSRHERGAEGAGQGAAASRNATAGRGVAAAGEQLCQHHCPVAHVAAEYPQLCEAETEAFGRLLGTPVQRLATIAHGDGVCTTHITAPSLRAAASTRGTDTQVGGLPA